VRRTSYRHLSQPKRKPILQIAVITCYYSELSMNYTSLTLLTVLWLIQNWNITIHRLCYLIDIFKRSFGELCRQYIQRHGIPFSKTTNLRTDYFRFIFVLLYSNITTNLDETLTYTYCLKYMYMVLKIAGHW